MMQDERVANTIKKIIEGKPPLQEVVLLDDWYEQFTGFKTLVKAMHFSARL